MNKVKIFKSRKSFLFESGRELKELSIAYHTFGQINEQKDNVIWVFHALSGNSDVLDWWGGLFGPGCLYDPEEYFIICANIIGSPYGSSKPESLDFPLFTVRDLVKAHLLLAESLSIKRIHKAIGASCGGSQAIEFAYSFEGKIENLILIACCARESAWSIAIHEAQRLALKADPTFGSKNGGKAGLKAARGIAMLTYRTADAFIETQTDVEDKMDHFRASSYIAYQGEKFVRRFDALSYYYLSKCLDTHNIGRDRGGEVQALKKIKIPTLVIGIESDQLIPPSFQQFLAKHIPNASFAEIESKYGHDGFLVENEKIAERIRTFSLFNTLQ